MRKSAIAAGTAATRALAGTTKKVEHHHDDEKSNNRHGRSSRYARPWQTWHPRKAWAAARLQAHAPRRSKDTARTNAMVQARCALVCSSNWRRLSHDCRSVLGTTGAGQRWR